MRALVLRRAADQVRLEFDADHADPVAGEREVLIRVTRAGICSTDLELARGYMGFTGIPGHEFVGIVERGPAALRGRRVVAEINCASVPGLDEAARKHEADRTVLGIAGRDGAFAEYVAVPAENCHIVPDGISDEQAVFVEPLAAACQVLVDCPVTRETRVAVLGPGRLGLLCAQVLARQTSRLVVAGRSEASLAAARGLGLAARPVEALARREWDVVVECTGAADGLRTALQCVRPRGVVVLKSTYAAPPTIDLAPIVIDEIRVVGSRCGPFDEALKLLAEQAVQVEPLICARYPLSRGVEAFARAAEPGALKVLLSPREEA